MAHMIYNPFLKRETLCVKKGKTKDGKQKYLCKETNKIFVYEPQEQETKKSKLSPSSKNVAKNKNKQTDSNASKVTITVESFKCQTTSKKISTKKSKVSEKKVISLLVNYMLKNYELIAIDDNTLVIKVKW